MKRTMRATGVLIAALFPEIGLGVALFDAARQRIRMDDPERGEAVQWVILAAIGAAIAITVGTLLYNKLKTKTNNINLNTPAAGQ